eukprot:3186274-Pyramimonas_sp.AAC.1
MLEVGANAPMALQGERDRSAAEGAAGEANAGGMRPTRAPANVASTSGCGARALRHHRAMAFLSARPCVGNHASAAKAAAALVLNSPRRGPPCTGQRLRAEARPRSRPPRSPRHPQPHNAEGLVTSARNA